jgi:hypothetical protein
MLELTQLERSVLDTMLSGPETWKGSLRDQLSRLRVQSREDTGAGTYTYFEAGADVKPADVPEHYSKSPLEVRARHPQLSGEIFCLLWLNEGRIALLEIASGSTPLPTDEKFVFAR